MKNQNPKGQVSTEFLMTYGLAIVALFIVVGALAYFNVLSPSKYFPEECTLFEKIECTDFKVSKSSIAITVRNRFGELLNPFNITILSDYGCNNVLVNAASGLADSETEKLTFPCSPALTGDDYAALLNISYTGTAGLYHVAYGKLKSKIE